MSWHSAVIEFPDEWWEEIDRNDATRRWWSGLTQWLSSHVWTHVHTQTFRQKRNDPIRAGEVYCNYLAEHTSKFQLKAALWAVEFHPGGHGCHIHSLWNSSYDDSLRRLSALSPRAAETVPPLYRLVKATGERSLGFSRLWEIDEDSYQTAIRYALKYILKGHRTEAHNSLPPQPWEPVETEMNWGFWTPP